jgi:hypothetical protein
MYHFRTKFFSIPDLVLFLLHGMHVLAEVLSAVETGYNIIFLYCEENNSQINIITCLPNNTLSKRDGEHKICSGSGQMSLVFSDYWQVMITGSSAKVIYVSYGWLICVGFAPSSLPLTKRGTLIFNLLSFALSPSPPSLFSDSTTTKGTDVPLLEINSNTVLATLLLLAGPNLPFPTIPHGRLQPRTPDFVSRNTHTTSTLHSIVNIKQTIICICSQSLLRSFSSIPAHSHV